MDTRIIGRNLFQSLTVSLLVEGEQLNEMSEMQYGIS
jgi:hypothetical protein